MLRKSMIGLIEHEPDLECCGEADTVSQTPALVLELGPDLVLMDRRLLDGDSLPLIALLSARDPSLPILMLSQAGEPASVEQALRAGARGYLLKQDAAHQLVSAIRALLEGKTYVSPALASTTMPGAAGAANIDARRKG